jgi:hypothetical protein
MGCHRRLSENELSWRDFLRQHAATALACDFFTVETAWLTGRKPEGSSLGTYTIGCARAIASSRDLKRHDRLGGLIHEYSYAACTPQAASDVGSRARSCRVVGRSIHCRRRSPKPTASGGGRDTSLPDSRRARRAPRRLEQPPEAATEDGGVKAVVAPDEGRKLAVR